ncbi:biopolymer transporter ExbD [Ruegeria sp. 2205SS24-7]|uniref:ExbD/TolR family protein n=1 Tax=Ruegeria discodermiae TaxID=3064389 RepID=UPI0027421F65|nr:biopolymer transporter ExbD [Ruegeria sp. 2205SS24-7]MDP5217226.1 biopolymer transporter ExbD [Ruegeria sp. 2205SS24-7]
MSGDLSLRRPKPPRALISLVPMIDVMLILLVFFMVTSTYLNLDMIPALAQRDAPAPVQAASDTPAGVLLIRLGADGQPVLRGQAFEAEALAELLSARLSDAPGLQVIILPTGSARMQALVSLMDLVTQSGVREMRVVRLEAAQ